MRLVAAIVMLLGTAAVARAEPTAVAIDAYGRTIGPLVAPGSVLMTVAGRVYRIAFHEAGFDADAPRPLYYESADCSGPGYLGDTLIPPLAYVATDTQAPGQQLVAPGAPSAQRQISSTRIVTDPQAQCQPVSVPGPGPNPAPVPASMRVAPALVLPWGPGFAPPFTVQLR